MICKDLKDYIVVVDNIMPLPTVNAVLDEYEKSDDWVLATIDGAEERTDVRNCKVIGLSLNSVVEKNKDIRQSLDAMLFSVAGQAIQKYVEKFPLSIVEQDSGYELLKYETGGFYIQHVDSFFKKPRSISCSFILNDDYEGGEFAFFDRELVYKVKKGSCIMFPSNFTYPHEIMPVTSGTRYSIITWFI
jgi:predicted 2-oxoglutarate/Fe(II)-dependent dioxygenase YbiX